MDVQQFFKKNLRYITLILLALFLLKSMQNCNRNMEVRKLEKEIVYLNDSLTTIHGSEKTLLLQENLNLKDSIKDLAYQVKLSEAERDAANKRADAIQSTASKIRENTTIKIENKSDKDTISVNK
jgi:limonene-1,2-epoxide hydrolase